MIQSIIFMTFMSDSVFVLYSFDTFLSITITICIFRMEVEMENIKQAGAELCQAHCSLPTASLAIH